MRRLKHLEVEHARLKKLVAERDLEIEVMKEVASKNWAWAASRPRPQPPTGPNQVWSYDFVFDRCANG